MVSRSSLRLFFREVWDGLWWGVGLNWVSGFNAAESSVLYYSKTNYWPLYDVLSKRDSRPAVLRRTRKSLMGLKHFSFLDVSSMTARTLSCNFKIRGVTQVWESPKEHTNPLWFEKELRVIHPRRPRSCELISSHGRRGDIVLWGSLANSKPGLGLHPWKDPCWGR